MGAGSAYSRPERPPSEADAILAWEWPGEPQEPKEPDRGVTSPTTFEQRVRTHGPDRLIRLTPRSEPRRFDMLQQWEGVVAELHPDEVVIELIDLRDRSAPREVATVSLQEFSPADTPLLTEGSVLYWSIGFETSRGGQIRRVSEIRVRRTPRWSKWRVGQLGREADDILRQLNE